MRVVLDTNIFVSALIAPAGGRSLTLGKPANSRR